MRTVMIDAASAGDLRSLRYLLEVVYHTVVYQESSTSMF